MFLTYLNPSRGGYFFSTLKKIFAPENALHAKIDSIYVYPLSIEAIRSITSASSAHHLKATDRATKTAEQWRPSVNFQTSKLKSEQTIDKNEKTAEDFFALLSHNA